MSWSYLKYFSNFIFPENTKVQPVDNSYKIRNCTPFNCHCYENGIDKPCDTYKICINCYKDFGVCKCLSEYVIKPTKLIKTCTTFDCNCYENGLNRACETYQLCIKCNKSFNDCNCKI